MKTIKVAEATEIQLDWLVVKCEGLPLRLDPMGFKKDAPDSAEAGWWLWLAQPGSMLIGPGGDTTGRRRYSPSTNWAQGGPIIERECIWLGPVKYMAPSVTPPTGREWMAKSTALVPHAPTFGLTALAAAMRCYVTSKLGDTAEVPEELT